MSRPQDPRGTIDGVGDVVLAGHPTPYPHLRTDSVHPSAGTLFAAARRVGDVIRSSPPPATGTWTGEAYGDIVAEEAGRTAGSLVAVVATVPPADVVATPPSGQDTRTDRETLLYAARGEVHVVEISATGHLHNVRRLVAGRGFAWGSRRHHQIINTGSVPALLVHASSLGA
ncbi:hypothetical protein J4H86_19105 [Spiractinospora alimapuensis]|uniref:hypothetical protein n=1 Tax=Spiractinospora alimapuensis TaxID=2820884 RepID=UPI001F450CC4|nr:hypothetical protein [Spiractinospora alimapuensis]QVQ50948.1 hypothetical protein J4H86_19105 [Spiractinospora alimapuensis]